MKAAEVTTNLETLSIKNLYNVCKFVVTSAAFIQATCKN